MGKSHFTRMCLKRGECRGLQIKLKNAQRLATKAAEQERKARSRLEKLRIRHAKAQGQLMHYEDNWTKWAINPHNLAVLTTPSLCGLLVSSCKGWDHAGALLKRVFVVGALDCDILNMLHDTCKSMSSAVRFMADEVACDFCRKHRPYRRVLSALAAPRGPTCRHVC